MANQDDAKRMREGLAAGQTCIDCHKGIAHKLPDMAQGYRKLYAGLVAMAQAQGGTGDMLYPIATISYYLAAADASAGADVAGSLLVATPLKVLDRSGGAIQVEIDGWQQDQVDQVIYALRGQRIFRATAKPAAVGKIDRLSTETDPATDLVWHQVRLVGWVPPGQVVNDLGAINDYASTMFTANCSICHSQPTPDQMLANQWSGALDSMKEYVSLDKEETRLLQKYLQLRASDTAPKPE